MKGKGKTIIKMTIKIIFLLVFLFLLFDRITNLKYTKEIYFMLDYDRIVTENRLPDFSDKLDDFDKEFEIYISKKQEKILEFEELIFAKDALSKKDFQDKFDKSKEYLDFILEYKKEYKVYLFDKFSQTVGDNSKIMLANFFEKNDVILNNEIANLLLFREYMAFYLDNPECWEVVEGEGVLVTSESEFCNLKYSSLVGAISWYKMKQKLDINNILGY